MGHGNGCSSGQGIMGFMKLQTEEKSRVIRVLQCWKSTGWHFSFGTSPQNNVTVLSWRLEHLNPQRTPPKLVPSGSAHQQPRRGHTTKNQSKRGTSRAQIPSPPGYFSPQGFYFRMKTRSCHKFSSYNLDSSMHPAGQSSGPFYLAQQRVFN